MAAVEERGELHRVPVEVDPLLEIAEITRCIRASEDGGPALLFEQVKGSRIPVATNLFGSFGRMALALSVADLADLSPWLEGLLQGKSSVSSLLANASVGPQVMTSPPCHQVVEREPDLNTLPFIQGWPRDGWPASASRFATLPLVISKDPLSESCNCGMYLLQATGPQELAVCWGDGSGGANHHLAYQQIGKPMPVAVAFGGDPALMVAASMPLPVDVDELHFAGLLKHNPVETCPGITVPLMVPAHADIVLEGYISPGETTAAGSFGNHTGYYRKPLMAAKMTLTCITRRRQPVFPATVVGPPPVEDCYLAKACERLILPLLRLEVPEVREINMPMPWIFQPAALVSICKENPGDGTRILRSIRASSLFRRARFLAVVDEETDPTNEMLAAWQVMNAVTSHHDIVAFEDPPGLGIDGTRKIPGDSGFDERVPLRVDDDVHQLVLRRWREYGFR
jgi:4-hydroxy-3-polyprenylbenzoate decarboxylase